MPGPGSAPQSRSCTTPPTWRSRSGWGTRGKEVGATLESATSSSPSLPSRAGTSTASASTSKARGLAKNVGRRAPSKEPCEEVSRGVAWEVSECLINNVCGKGARAAAAATARILGEPFLELLDDEICASTRSRQSRAKSSMHREGSRSRSGVAGRGTASRT